MKELSIEEKEKAYDEALERARNLHKDAIDMGENIRAKQCEIIFPQLKESKDENIKQWLIGYFQQYKKDGIEKYASGLKVDDILAWLEKQGESSDQIHYWTEEEIEPIISDYLRGAEHYGGMIGRLRCLKPKSLEKQCNKRTDVEESMREVGEKARAYDEAIKRAKEINNEHKAQPFNVMLKVFPELKESEDERIRKTLIALIEWSKSFAASGITANEAKGMIAWLEKQKERSTLSKNEEYTSTDVFIEKACEWLSKNTPDYINAFIEHDFGEFVDDFRKAQKGE